MMYLFEHRSLIVVGFETMGRCNAESVSQLTLYELGKDPVYMKLPSLVLCLPHDCDLTLAT